MGLASAFVFAIGSLICHQKPERSFFWDGQQFPVCARCTGLYLSGAAGIIGWVVFKTATRWRPQTLAAAPTLRLLMLAAVPTVLSVGTAWLGVWDGSNMTRAMLAVPLGVGAGLIVASVATKDLK